MKKSIFLLAILQFNLIATGLFAQTNITSKLDMNKAMGGKAAGEFQLKIYRAATTGKIKVYKDDSLSRKMSVDDIKSILNNDETITVYYDTNDPSAYYDTVIKKTLTEKDISGLLGCIIFNGDISNNQYSAYYRSFAISMKISKAGYNLGEQPLFWFGINDMALIFSPTEIESFRKSVEASTENVYYENNPVLGRTQHLFKMNKYTGKNAIIMFNRKIFSGIANGRLVAYSDNGFITTLRPDEVINKPAQIEIKQVPTDALHPVATIDTVTYLISPDSICRYFATEKFTFDINKLSFTVNISGLGLGYNFINNKKLTEEILCWIKPGDISRMPGGSDFSGLSHMIYKATKDRFDIYYRE